MGFFSRIILVSVLLLPGFVRAGDDAVVQYSTIEALLEGIYDGEMNFGGLKRYGDFGMGTFNGLDGEMIALDGVFYQIKSDGKVYPVADTAKLPFATMKFFKPDMSFEAPAGLTMEELAAFIDTKLPSVNLPVAVRITGSFTNLMTRSVAAQKKPYPKLLEAAKGQKVFDFMNAYGVMAGFRFPAYLQAVNVPGYHLHFIDTKQEAGGHVLTFVTGQVIVDVDVADGFSVVLPKEGDFLKQKFGNDHTEALKAVE